MFFVGVAGVAVGERARTITPVAAERPAHSKRAIAALHAQRGKYQCSVSDEQRSRGSTDFIDITTPISDALSHGPVSCRWAPASDRVLNHAFDRSSTAYRYQFISTAAQRRAFSTVGLRSPEKCRAVCATATKQGQFEDAPRRCPRQFAPGRQRSSFFASMVRPAAMNMVDNQAI